MLMRARKLLVGSKERGCLPDSLIDDDIGIIIRVVITKNERILVFNANE